VAQGGVTLGSEQGDLGANFSYLGNTRKVKIRPDLTFTLTHTMRVEKRESDCF